MNMTKWLSGSRSTDNLISRIGTVLDRFGFTSTRFARFLEIYSNITIRTGCTATLPITAVILKRHPALIRSYQQGLEYAIHGYVHIDYRQLPVKDQIEHYQKAIDTFFNCQVPFTGFRAPYLRFNDDTALALTRLHFLYDSSDSIYWNVINNQDFAAKSWKEYLRLLEYYQAQDALNYLSVPRFSADSQLVQIPVSLPDDEAIVERLGIVAYSDITRIWNAILNETYKRGELFTLQLHPERIDICGNPLHTIILQAQSTRPPIWIATLAEISRWYKEKQSCGFDIQIQGQNQYNVQARGPARATLLTKNCQISSDTAEWYGEYRSTESRDFTLESPILPVIGVKADSSLEAINFLRSEGYKVEITDQPNNYALYFQNLNHFRRIDEKSLSETIDNANVPLIRFWRWPDKARSALSISGDIDSITIFDFALRLIEAQRQRNRQKYNVEVASAGAPV